MKQNFFCLMLAIVLAASGAYAQSVEEKIENENVVLGEIIKDGKSTIGYIKMMYAYDDGSVYPAPWQYQSDIRFIPKEDFEKAEKIKNKMYEKYDAKDIDGYKYDTLVYESVKYADMSAVGTGMIAKKMFMQKILDDKISLYYHYDSPPAVVSGETFASYYIECAKPHLVYQVGDEGKLKLVNDMNVEKELADCPDVVTKYKNGEYEALKSNGEASGANKLLNKVLFREGVRKMVIEDYNKSCK
ncbi:hypothetical protein [Fulvivirga kasyanovii]|uniref:DUF4852 domain-containing protein n=1 Tax=Fulvivirga kasyanovii TaxID=396812 RepID=A0ABW9RR56_9BACT|nr:hypothetical protein [Fulvivirga kasyanovii]MTI26186.1 hypothetical protein [Fulvivirga kasyanovii]